MRDYVILEQGQITCPRRQFDIVRLNPLRGIGAELDASCGVWIDVRTGVLG
ncbi:hypothetical protein [Kribbella sp. NBC_00889]|uniref:hypothetical protein n=1 Tax=Kribbella sp. NBC_00889 TaxID=2975974 RepID=UPI0038661F56|nr:hypothetical protein OG817_16855 [Kribbella sp. NBC_00889]